MSPYLLGGASSDALGDLLKSVSMEAVRGSLLSNLDSVLNILTVVIFAKDTRRDFALLSQR